MSLILNIDTAITTASISIAKGGNILGEAFNTEQRDHGAFIQPAIKKILSISNYKLHVIDAVAVTAGPGSYTGLRVGLATAKGLCYALNKPLILINTLEVMAQASINERIGLKTGNPPLTTRNSLFSPMIDARRLEVFTALYNGALQPLVYPAAVILNEHTFEEYLNGRLIVFSGSGQNKFKNILQHPNAIFTDTQHDAAHLAMLAAKAFEQKQFADVAYSEPFYLKEFFTPAKPPNR